jgi:hypothetical protein
MTIIRTVFVFFLCCAGGWILSAAAEEEISIEAALEAQEIFWGDTILFQVSIRGLENPPEPDWTPLNQDFTLSPTREESLNSQSIMIINGQMRRTVSYGRIFRRYLTPKQAGALRIPELEVKIKGQTYRTRALLLNVIAPEKQDAILLEVRTDRERVYPTQRFTVNLKISVKHLPGTQPNSDPLSILPPPTISLNWLEPPAGLRALETTRGWLQNYVSRDGRGFSLEGLTVDDGFFSAFSQPRLAVLEFPRQMERRKGLDGQIHDYHAYELTRTFLADAPCVVTFGPVLLKGRRYNSKPVVVTANPRTVEVREVPFPRPTDYFGGIGAYKVTASVEPARLREGDPLTLTLNFERLPGSGALERVMPPDLTRLPELTEAFAVMDKDPIGKIEGDVKQFRYGLRAKKAGAVPPPLTVSAFDPDKEAFTTYAVSPPPLVVEAVDWLKPKDVLALSAVQTDANVLAASSTGLFQAPDDVRLLKNKKINELPFAAYPPTLLLIFLLLLIWVGRHRRFAHDDAWRRRTDAWTKARRRLEEVEKAWRQTGPATAVPLLRSALLSLIADMRNLPAAGLTVKDADAALLAAGWTEPSRKEFSAFLEGLESLAYGGGKPCATTTEDKTPLEHARRWALKLNKL